MKSIIKIFLIIIFSVSLIKAQTESLPLIEDLERGDYLAILTINADRLVEYVSYLDTSIFKQKHFHIVREYLETLSELNSSNIIPITKAFIDSLDSPYFLADEKGKINITESRLFATEILFEHGDYSTSQYIFDYINTNRDSLKHYVFFIRRSLKLILKNIPSFAEQAKTELIYIAQNNSWDEMRWLALLDLNNVLGSEINYLNVDRLINDEYSHNRVSAVEFLLKNNYPDLDELIIERLYADTSRFARIELAEILLDSIGTPINYNVVKNYLELEQNRIVRSNIEVALEFFVPKPPYNLDLVEEKLDYTLSVIDTLLVYTWLGDITFKNEIQSILQSAKTNLQAGDSLACRVQVKAFQDSVDKVYKDSLNTDSRFVTIEGWKFLYWNAQYILDRLPEPQSNPNLLVNLKNSQGSQIPASNVMYYESAAVGWKDAVNNGDGTFTVITTKPTVSIRMFYEYTNQTVHNVPAQNNTFTFTTVNAAVELKNSLGSFVDVGTVQYYAGAWRTFGTTVNGVAYKELLPINYSFRMTYEYVPIDKQQDISTNSTVTFSTVLCTVKVTNTNNLPLAGVNTKYYSTAWRDIGQTNANGEATKELLPKNLSFRATYSNVSADKQQDIGVNGLVEIQLNVP